MTGNSERHIAVIGLGRMGGAFADRLLAEGWHVRGYDVDPNRVQAFDQPHFQRCVSAADAAAQAPLVLTSVFDGGQLLQALTSDGGILAGAGPHTIVIDASTISPESSAECATACAARSVRFVRATVSGNPGVVRAGRLGVYCSGEEADYRDIAELLGSIAASHIWLGPDEEARYAKLVINLLVTGTNVLLAEALGIAQAAGISQKDFFECVQDSVVGSPFTRYKGDAIRAGDYGATITSPQVRKDLGYVLNAARALGIGVPVAGIVDQVYGIVTEAGYGDLDFGAAALLHQAARDSWQQAGSGAAGSA